MSLKYPKNYCQIFSKDLFTSASARVSFNFPRSSVKTTFAFIKKINPNVVEETDKVVEEEVETIIFHQIETKFIVEKLSKIIAERFSKVSFLWIMSLKYPKHYCQIFSKDLFTSASPRVSFNFPGLQ